MIGPAMKRTATGQSATMGPTKSKRNRGKNADASDGDPVLPRVIIVLYYTFTTTNDNHNSNNHHHSKTNSNDNQVVRSMSTASEVSEAPMMSRVIVEPVTGVSEPVIR